SRRRRGTGEGMNHPTWIGICLLACAVTCEAAEQSLDALVDREVPALVATYKTLHAAPELSHHENKTSELLAGRLRELGFEVTEHVGKYQSTDWQGCGVVGLMKNGDGPVVLVRTDLDALPVEEKTGVAYASKVKTKNEAGQDVSV